MEFSRDPCDYASESRSLAALEILVHFDVIPRDFILTEIYIPEKLGVLVIDGEALPQGWDGEPALIATQQIGDRWVKEGRDITLSVPSSVVPSERNFIINPEHEKFQKVEFSRPAPFRFDPRLK